jgi:hypothetical protein
MTARGESRNAANFEGQQRSTAANHVGGPPCLLGWLVDKAVLGFDL